MYFLIKHNAYENYEFEFDICSPLYFYLKGDSAAAVGERP